MTPRLDVTAVPKDASIDEAIETCVQADHERVPVYEGNLDNIIGVVNIRDLVRARYYGEGESALASVVQPTLHVPESKNADEPSRRCRRPGCRWSSSSTSSGRPRGSSRWRTWSRRSSARSSRATRRSRSSSSTTTRCSCAAR
ncbi:CBS domain-containing protein [Halobaculum litoreum]|uniref:CBS domain-containing protein n=1 Tax=Halobaculum litoreum TaxID=3031998 RepID=A0ABD5XQR5_9EURY